MSLIVQKFGGTSVDGPERIRAVAEHVVRTRQQGHEVVVVVSAMGRATDDLIRLAQELSPEPPAREMDMLVTAGERIAMSLLCIAIDELGVTASSFTGSQAGILTDSAHGRAKILEVRADRLRQALSEGQIVVVAGFQGMSLDRNITTLGRGGSDTTAVALAAALGADACEIYTDVAGVFSADPRVVPNARMLNSVSYEEMLEMAATGGRVLALRSVEFARNHHVALHVRSSFSWAPGTWVREEADPMEAAIISAVTHDTSEAKVTILAVPDKPGIAARLFRALADEGVNVDMIVQNTSVNGTTDISYTLPLTDLPTGLKVSEAVAADLDAAGVTHDAEIARISLVGAGMKTNPGVAATMFETLAAHGVNIEMISTSSIRISCVVRAGQVDEGVRALHTAFDLDDDAVAGEVAVL
ncbi:MAG: aspartate kinase [Acidimicrobiales bacterium]